jgi:hypothetical protein
MSNMHGFSDLDKDKPKDKKTNNNYAGGTKR